MTLTVTLTGVTDASSQMLPPTSVSANILIGDFNVDKTVNITDEGLTQGRVGIDGNKRKLPRRRPEQWSIISADVKAVKGARGHTLP